MLRLAEGEYTGTIVRKADIDGAIVSTSILTQASNTAWHCHENLHLCFVFEGGKAETQRQTQFTQKGGSVFFYHSGEVHRWITPQTVSKSANIEISAGFLRQYEMEESNIRKSVFDNVGARSLILKMQKELLDDHCDFQLNLKSLLLELLCWSPPSQTRDKPRWVAQLEGLLRDKWNQKLTLAQIADTIGVHPVTISKSFRKYFFTTLGEYRRKLKIDQSISLIKESEMSLSEIAVYCGFADQSHFIRNFRDLTGFLPKHFRHF